MPSKNGARLRRRTIMSEMSRREFVTVAAALAAAGACACCGADLVLGEPTPGTPGRPTPGPTPPSAGGSKVDAGAVSQYSKDGIWDTFAKSNKVLIVRAGDKIYAPTATCTHKSCTVRLKSPGQIACPCHGSKFGPDG